MIKFIHKDESLKEGESFMFSTKVSPSPLIKVFTIDTIPERWGSWTDEQFFKKYCDPAYMILHEHEMCDICGAQSEKSFSKDSNAHICVDCSH